MRSNLIKGCLLLTESISIMAYVLLVPRHPFPDLLYFIIVAVIYALLAIAMQRTKWNKFVLINSIIVVCFFYLAVCFVPDIKTMCDHFCTFKTRDTYEYDFHYNTYTDSFSITKIKGFGNYMFEIEVSGKLEKEDDKLILVLDSTHLNENEYYMEDYSFRSAVIGEMYLRNDTLFGFNGETCRLKKL